MLIIANDSSLATNRTCKNGPLDRPRPGTMPSTGFNAKVCKPQGRAQNECPAWPSAQQVVDGCLQRMWDEGPGRRFSKHGHYVNVSRREYESVACGFAKDSNGDVWSVQNFR
ncbi:MAG: CAP domain-containing protein [Deltaproteobacteria bacterium]|nr:CAP domain-containing protein [Deltaproteobacteria bacterium]NND30083.1 hypothetical protein [Myxococcales bacterium]MBT8465861.1 CAP domain-containing protein [Deltaproteobacteria bacterium]MBT8481791.1 CAP domain-containing protein [Deltaproteobacteria bacterium]NNL24653.1 hypothetical protein [Myxococcales bacterium]